jgi:hypothetical protein
MKRDMQKYASVIAAFLDNRLEAEEFDTQFRELWMEDVNRQYALRTEEEQRIECQVIDDYDSGLISREEFARRWGSLYHDAGEDWEIAGALGALHSTCSNFTRDASLLATGTYVCEAELRDHASRVMKMLRLHRFTGSGGEAPSPPET